MSISPTFYKQLFVYSFFVLSVYVCIFEEKYNIGEKAGCKMTVKLTVGGEFKKDNISSI